MTVAETPEEAIAAMRKASEVVSDVLPSALAELVGDHLLDNIDAVLRGSTPQMQWVAYELLALAEQQQPRPDTPAIALMRPDRKVVAVLDNPQFEGSYQLVGIGDQVDGHRWARPSELAGWIPLVPAQNGEQ